MAKPLYSLSELGLNRTCQQCNRQGIHCPGCGAKSRYASMRRSEIIENAQGRFRNTAYTCRSCGLIYTDEDWLTKCEAPILENASMKERRERDTAAEGLIKALANPDTRLEAIRIALAQHPAPKPKESEDSFMEEGDIFSKEASNH